MPALEPKTHQDVSQIDFADDIARIKKKYAAV
jgi:hypothetical protein